MGWKSSDVITTISVKSKRKTLFLSENLEIL